MTRTKQADRIKKRNKRFGQDWPWVVLRAGGCCEVLAMDGLPCASTESLTIHHSDRDSNNNAMENRVVVCKWCHQVAHFYRPIMEAVYLLDDVVAALDAFGWWDSPTTA